MIRNACLKIALLKTCFEQSTKESKVGTFKNIWKVAVNC